MAKGMGALKVEGGVKEHMPMKGKMKSKMKSSKKKSEKK